MASTVASRKPSILIGFVQLNDCLSAHGILFKQGALVAASIIEAPSSAKNNSGERDFEMHQMRKGNQWLFDGRLSRMNMHMGMEPSSGMTRSVHSTAVRRALRIIKC